MRKKLNQDVGRSEYTIELLFGVADDQCDTSLGCLPWKSRIFKELLSSREGLTTTHRCMQLYSTCKLPNPFLSFDPSALQLLAKLPSSSVSDHAILHHDYDGTICGICFCTHIACFSTAILVAHPRMRGRRMLQIVAFDHHSSYAAKCAHRRTPVEWSFPGHLEDSWALTGLVVLLFFKNKHQG
jgi:hypothetical protein